ncbi:MAG: histidine kinase dimerization/phosphoacceptor domain -containing protein [bacterium]
MGYRTWFCIFLLFLFSSNAVLAQSFYFKKSGPRQFIISTIDSLNNQAERYIGSYIDSLAKPAEAALSLSKRISYREGIEKANYLLALNVSTHENYSTALDMLYHYLDYVKSEGDLSAQVTACVRIGLLYLEIENFDLGYSYCKNAVEIAKKSGNQNDLAMAYSGLANFYYRSKLPGKALECADSSQKYSHLADNKESKTRLEKLYGDIYIETGNLNLSLQHYHRALSNFIVLRNLTEEAIVLTRIAHICQLQNKFSEALSYSKQALAIRLQLKNKEFISHSFINLGTAYLHLGETDSALAYYQKGLEESYLSDNQRAIEYALLQLYLYYKGQQRTKEAQIKILQKENEIHRLDIQNRSYSELITQLIIGIVGVLILILVYIAERNKLGRSRLEVINRQLDQEIQERKEKEVQLRKSEQLYRFVTDNTLDLIVRMDRKFNYLYISPSVFRMFGYDAQMLPEKLPGLAQVIDPEFWQELFVQYRDMIRSKEPLMATYLAIRKDGSTFWAESLVNPIFEESTGKLKETITVVRDISDRIAYQEVLSENARQKEVLLREIHHRVKNNFSILIGLMNMQAVSTDPGEFMDFLTDLQGRVRTMSLVHELLYRSEDIDHIEFAEYLKQLISVISSVFKSKPVALHTRFDPCVLDVEVAMPLGLIVNEILTNAFKYAFSANKEGELWVDLKLLDEEQTDPATFTHSLTIRDNGPGLPDDFDLEARKSMGSQIIHLLIGQIEGELTYSSDHGASFTIFFRDEKVD